MSQPVAYPITYGVLGLLARWGPLSGYDLKRLFDHILSPMWGAAQSQIYNELRRMKDLGWVEMQREEQEARPDRKVYSITSQGEAALKAWQAEAPEVLQLRDELLLKILFGAFADSNDLITNIKKGIADHELRLLTYRQSLQYAPLYREHVKEGWRPNPYVQEVEEREEDPYIALIARFAIEFENAYLRSLHDMLAFLEEQKEESNERDTIL